MEYEQDNLIYSINFIHKRTPTVGYSDGKEIQKSLYEPRTFSQAFEISQWTESIDRGYKAVDK